jgi:hypothetical protein
MATKKTNEVIEQEVVNSTELGANEIVATEEVKEVKKESKKDLRKLINKDTNKVVFKGETIPTKDFTVSYDAENKNRVIEIKAGDVIEVRDTIYEKIINNKTITDKYDLNVKRRNRWWYSVYFGEKKN